MAGNGACSFVSIVLLGLSLSSLASSYWLVCYFTNWAQYRQGIGQFLPEDIPPDLCTHVVYAFADIEGDTSIVNPLEWNDLDFYKRVMTLKSTNPQLKVLLAVGGYSAGTADFEAISSTSAQRQLFADNAVSFLRQHGFDGLDVDWEFPASTYKTHFTLLLETLHNTFEAESSRTGKDQLLLTVAVSGYKTQIETSYEVHLIHNYVDYISIMSYDYYGPWSSVLGHNSPLYVPSQDRNTAGSSLLSQNASVHYWHTLGCPLDKLVLGLASYGRTFLMSSSSQHQPGDPYLGAAGAAGAYSATPGFLAYYEVCQLLDSGSWTRVWMNDSKVPYAYGLTNGQWTWLAYDDVQSMKTKAQYILDRGLGGAMFWTLDFDDFANNVCGQGNYPLIGQIGKALQAAPPPSSTSTGMPASSSTPVAVTTPATQVSTSQVDPSGLHLVCYFTNWAQYRSGVGKYVPEDYQPGLCTHVVYAFAKIIGASASISTIEWNDEDMYQRVIRLKDADPQLKVLLAVGGYSAGTADFEAISSTSAQRQLFADNAVSYLRQHAFDGLDVDWEYPASTHKTYFTLFLETLHNTFEAESSRTGKDQLLLTVAVSGYKTQIETSYEVHLIHKYVDYISIMSYDYYGPWSSVLGHNSPLYVPSQDRNTAGSSLLSQNASVHYWHTLGCPLDKLVLGLASYGRTFLMSSSSQHQPGDPYLGAAGAAGAYSATPGFLAYYEVCQLLDSGSWTRVWMNDSKVPYAYGLTNGQWTWLAYDDVQSMKTKAQYILDRGLGGAMFWTLDFDDFANNVCGQGNYPLIGQIGKALQAAPPPSSTSTGMPASSSTPVAVTTPATQVSTSQVDPSGLHLVCYFTNWAQYRSGVGKYVPEDYQPGLCTHVVYAFAKIIGASASISTIEWNDEDMYQRVIRLKDADPQLKVLLAVGGYSAGTADFEAISSTSAQRQLFADNAVSYLRQHAFDGLDVDWEYPASTHKTYFTLFLETLHNTFEAESSRTGKDQLLLTVAVSGYKTQIETSYEVHLIHKYVDYISIMSYDYYGPWSSVLGHNSPLYVPSQDRNTAGSSLLSQNASVHYWHTLGCPLDKLVLGLASYGRTFLMSSSSQHQPGDPYLGAAGAAGAYSATPGFLAYYEVCQLLDSGSWTRVWMNDSKIPYAYGLTNGQWTWLAYDDVQSMKTKAQYILDRGLGGAMFWTLDFDDFANNVCGQGNYPLIGQIGKALQAAPPPSSTSTGMPASSSTPVAVTTPATQVSTSQVDPSGLHLVCYFTNWTQYRSGVGKYVPEDYQPGLCTHVVYAFAKIIGASASISTIEWNDEDMYQRVIRLKDTDPQLKVLLAVGGYSAGTADFEAISSTSAQRQLFADNAVSYLRQHAFDGLDVDWEYPASTHKTYFTLFLETLHNTFEAESSRTGKDQLLLTVAVSGYKTQIETSYEVHLIHKYVDYISIMSYDYYGPWSSVLGHNSPLYVPSQDRNTAGSSLLSQNASVHYWHTLGCPLDKLVLGLASYGRTFLMSSSSQHQPGDPYLGAAGAAGAYSATPGFLAYYEVCQLLDSGSWTRVWMNDSKVPYAYGLTNGQWTWLAYDDVQSMKIKADYIVDRGLGGAMFWTLDFDDFGNSTCKEGHYPLISEMQAVLQASTAITATETTYTSPTVTSTLLPSSSTSESTISTGLTSSSTVPTVTTTELQTTPDTSVTLTSISSTVSSTSSTTPPAASSTFPPVSSSTDPITSAKTDQSCLRVVCYFTNWAQYRLGVGKYEPEDYQPGLCTHMVYAFAKITSASASLSTIEWNDEDMYQRVIRLKDTDPQLKVLLAVGGYSAGTADFEAISSTSAQRQLFADNAVSFLRQHAFDGLDVDWEYPASTYKTRFTLLLETLHNTFEAESSRTGKEKLLLTVAVSGYKTQIETSYEVHLIHKYVDYVSIMSYDYYGPWSSVLGHNSPLYVPSQDRNAAGSSLLSQNASVHYWHTLGCPLDKLVLGLASYGRTFLMSSSSQHQPGDPYLGAAGTAGAYSATPGFLAYYEVCQLLDSGSWTRVWMNDSKVPYAYGLRNGQWTWLAYDDVQSMKTKAQYILDRGLGGAMFWTLDFDDFRNNVCSQGDYPLIGQIRKALRAAGPLCPVSTFTVMPATSSSPVPVTTPTTQVSTSQVDPSGLHLVCYFINWAQYRFGLGKYVPEDYQPGLCTHVVYAFANIISASASISTIEWNDEDMYQRVTRLKDTDPQLKVLLAVGGYSAGTADFEAISSTSAQRQLFADNAVSFLRQHGFDGLDVDWEFPASTHKTYFTLLLEILHSTFKAESSRTGKDQLLLTVAVSGYKTQIETSYEVHLIHNYVDYVSIMSYDYYGPWSSVLGHNSPLYVPSQDRNTAEFSLLSQNASVHYWHTLGCPLDKLVLGLASYGRTFLMSSSSQHQPGDPYLGAAGAAGPYSATPGFLAYYEVCQLLDSGSWTRVWMNDSKVPYAYGLRNGQWTWLAYDDVQSMKTKANYIVDSGLGGAMFWTLDFDDFANTCNEGHYPLTSEMRTALQAVTAITTTDTTYTTPNETIPATTSTELPTTSTQQPTTSTEPATTSTEPPTTTTQPPTTSSTQPPTTSSTQPPTTSSTQPPSTSTEPPTTSSTQLPTTSSTQPPTTSTEPPTTSSTQPPSTSTEPPTTSSTQPPTTSSTQPPTTSSTQPPTTSSTQPPTKSSTEPPTTSSTEPSSTEPPTTSSTEPPTTSSTEPPTTSSTEPPTTSSTELSSTETPTTSSTEPPTTSSTQPPTTSSTEPLTTSSTEPLTTSSTQPPTTSSTQLPTTSSTQPPTASSTQPPTTSSTQPLTTSSTEPSSTEPPTTLSTEPPTTPSTEPPTMSSTEPPTTSSAQPPTMLSTQPPTTSSTESTTMSSTEPPITSSSMLSTTLSTKSSTVVSTTSTMAPSTSSTEIPTSCLRVVCYFTNWAQYRSGVGKYVPEDYQPGLCTHVVYAFAKITSASASLSTIEWNDEDMYQRVTHLKDTDPQLKVLLAVGGYSAGTADFEAISSTSAQRQLFADNAVSFLRQHGFDGLDVDWEFPANTYKTHFTLLLETLYNTFEAESSRTGKDQLLLTVAVSGYKTQIETSYEVHLIHKYVDYVSIMSYDYYGPWSSVLGHNSPLYVPSQDRNTAGSNLLSQNASVHYWHTLGCPLDKLVLGLASYGRTFLMSSSSQHQPGDPYLGVAGAAGPYSATPGFLAYYEVCQLLDSGSWTRVWMNDSKVPYAYGLRNGQWTWLAYDDVQSMKTKAQFILDKGLGGAMFWTLDFDDFGNNVCNQGNYPLIGQIGKALQSAGPLCPVSTVMPASSSTVAVTTPATQVSTSQVDPSRLHLVCYFTNWAQYRSGVGKYEPEDYQPGLCTHMVYAFAKITSASASLATIEWNDEDMYQRVIHLKDTDPQLKVLLAVGGYSAGTADFEVISSTSAQRQLFADNAVSYLRQHGFDGLDVDWEFPASTHKTYFTLLLETLHNTFEAESSRTGKDQLLLTVAVSGYKTQIETSYEVHLIHNYVDYVSIMSYDYYGPWSSVLGHNSPLYVPSQDRNTAEFSLLSQNASVHYWHTLGCPLDKLVLGLASYGRTFLMSSSSQHQPGDPYLGAAGAAGPYSATPGFLAYYEVCQLLDSGSWTRVWMNDSKVPYAYGLRNGQWTWLAYDDPESMKHKADYIMDRGLGGAMFWTLDFDDFSHNVCNEGLYPLISEMKTALQAATATTATDTTYTTLNVTIPAPTSTEPPTTSTQQPTTSSTEPPTTSSTQPPTTSSTQPPTTSSTQPPTTSFTEPPTPSSTEPSTTLTTQPPATSSTQPPTTSSTEPPTTSSTEPPTTSSTEPPTTSSTEPPTTSSTQPPTTSTEPSTTSTKPPTTSSTEPPTTSSTEPPTTSTEPPTTSTQPPTTSSTEPPTTSTEPPTTSSTGPPTTSSTEPPTTSTEPPTTSSTEPPTTSTGPPTTSSTEPPTTSSTEPPTTSTEPPTTSTGPPAPTSSTGPPTTSTEPPTTSSTQPPTTSSTQPPTTSSTEPPTTSSTEPPTTSTQSPTTSTQPPTTSSTEPPTTSSTEPPTTSSTEPPTTSSTEPPTTSSTEPPTTPSTEPPTTSSTEPPTTSSTEPPTTSSTEPPTTSSTEPPTTSTGPPTTSTGPPTTSTEPPTTPSTEPPTTPSTEPPTTSSTQPPATSTQPPSTSTQPPTTPSTEPPTASSTQPPTASSTQPPTTSTEPSNTSVEPPTTSSTEPSTTSPTQPPTTSSTQPPTTSTQPPTASSTQPPTTSSTEPPTTSTQLPTTSSTQPPTTSSTQPPTTSSTQPPTTSTQPPTASSTEPLTTSSTEPPTTSTEPSTTTTTVAPTSSTVPPTSSAAASSTEASSLEPSTSTSVATATTSTTLTTTDTTPAVPTTPIESTTTSTTVQTTNYPTKPPATEAAVYVFTFVVNVEDPITFTVQWDSGLKDVMEAPFRILIGFIGLYLRLAASLPRGKRSLDAPMEVGANFSGSSVVTVAADKSGEQMNEFQSNLTTAMTQLTTVGQGNFSLQEESYDVTAFTEDLSDVCKAEGDVCGADYLCQNNACFYRCEFLNCGSHGQCYVLQTGQGSEAKCRCVSDELYDYSGETCEDSALKDLWIAAISGGVSGFFILLLVTVVACVYCKKRSSRKAVASHDSVSESQMSPQSPYRHTYVAPMYRPDYDNQAYNHGTSDLYLPPPTIKSESDMYIRFLTDRNGDRYPAHPQGQRSDLSSSHPYDNAFQPSRYSRYNSGKDNASPSGRGERQPTHLYLNPPAQRTDERVLRSENVFHYPLTRKGQGLQGHDGPHPSEGPAYRGYLPRPRVKGESSAREHRHGHEASARNVEQGQNPPSDLSSSSRGGFPTTQSEARHLFY